MPPALLCDATVASHDARSMRQRFPGLSPCFDEVMEGGGGDLSWTANHHSSLYADMLSSDHNPSASGLKEPCLHRFDSICELPLTDALQFIPTDTGWMPLCSLQIPAIHRDRDRADAAMPLQMLCHSFR